MSDDFKYDRLCRNQQEFPGGLLSLEIRSVNHRYLDLQMRLPEELRVIEPQLRELISAKVSRGKLECRVGINQVDSAAPTLELNQAVLKRLIEVSQQCASRPAKAAACRWAS